MIVTRARPKSFPWKRVIVPAAAFAVLLFALVWPPTHALLSQGPLKGVFGVVDGAAAAAARPFTFAYQQQQLGDRQREIKRLSDALETDRKTQADKDSRIAALQGQVNELVAAPQPTPAVVRPSAPPAAGLGAAPGPAVPEDVKRTAAYWAAMDAEKAAAIAQRLPDEYVNRVFAQMAPDAVADIMNALPAKTAARLAADAGAQTAGP